SQRVVDGELRVVTARIAARGSCAIVAVAAVGVQVAERGAFGLVARDREIGGRRLREPAALRELVEIEIAVGVSAGELDGRESEHAALASAMTRHALARCRYVVRCAAGIDRALGCREGFRLAVVPD